MCASILVILLISLLAVYHFGSNPQAFQNDIDFENIELYNKDPLTIWEKWYKEAKTIPFNKLPEGMTMATVRQDNHAAARTLLMRGYDKRGFQIYTDYSSPKAYELNASHHSTALVFVWCFTPGMDEKPSGTRQVRVEGIAHPLSRTENEHYFEKESIGSKIRATIQQQSQRITPRRKQEILEQARDLFTRAHQDPKFRIEMPEKWGGYVIRPRVYEFFQASPHSLATRIRFRLLEDVEREANQTFKYDLPDGFYPGEGPWVYEYLEF